MIRAAARYPELLFLVVAILLLGPLLAPGYVLTLDMVFAPNTAVPAPTSAGFPFYGLLWLLNLVLPGDFIQKLVLIAIIVLAGAGMYRFVVWLRPVHATVQWQLPALCAGLLYICNPFTYSRFMAGQFMVLLGYALLPWILRVWLHYLQKPTWHRTIAPVLLVVLLAMVSLHALGMVGVCMVVSVMGALYAHRADRPWLRSFGRTFGLALLGGAALCSYWLVPFILGQGHAAELVRSFTASDQVAFATHGTGWGRIGEILTLRGFWADSQNLYVTASEVYAWWNVVLAVVLGLVVVGFGYLWRIRKSYAQLLAIIAVLAVVLACGTQGTIFAPFNRLLGDVLPFFAGYREPQKFVLLLACLYALCAGVGVAAVWQYALERKQPIQTRDVVAFVLVLPLLFSPLMLWGFHGQLRAAEYPQDWYAINHQLNTLPAGKVLFLPWHQYMRFGFAGRIVANPADRFFDRAIISSNNPELRGLDHWSNDTDQARLEDHILPDAKAGGRDMARQLRQQGIRYVLVAKEYDYQKYDFVAEQPGLRIVKDSAYMRLYEVNK